MAEKSFTVERSTTVAAPADEVYGRIADFRRWVAWSPWERMDPELRRAYGGADSGLGATYAWEGNRKVGAGSMTIVDAVEDQKVVIDLRFLKPFKARNTTTFTLTPTDDGGGTEVRWRMEGPVTIMSRLMGIFMPMEKLVGRDFETGLAQLRSDVEG